MMFWYCLSPTFRFIAILFCNKKTNEAKFPSSNQTKLYKKKVWNSTFIFHSICWRVYRGTRNEKNVWNSAHAAWLRKLHKSFIKNPSSSCSRAPTLEILLPRSRFAFDSRHHFAHLSFFLSLSLFLSLSWEDVSCNLKGLSASTWIKINCAFRDFYAMRVEVFRDV